MSEDRAHGASTVEAPSSALSTDVACPFCGILCDDLVIAREGRSLKVKANSCPKATLGFETPLPDASTSIAGRPASRPEAIAAASSILRAAKCPGFGGLALDVEGMRAVMALADRCGGIVDHALSEGQFRNFKVLQSSGWFMSTLTETRNRADLIVIVGSDVEAMHPRFIERVAAPADTMFEGPNRSRTLVFLGEGLGPNVKPRATVGEVVHIACDNTRVGEVLDAVRARLKGVAIHAGAVAGVSPSDLDSLTERCRKALYGVMAWAPPSLAFANADLTVQIVAELVKDLNKTTRFACLSLGANEGAATAAAVCAWQSGYPLRVSFASGGPLYDPYAYALPRALADGAVDALVWASAFTADVKPPELPSSVPLVLIATPALIALRGAGAAVAIPVGTPGLDHAGRLIRCDSVVTLPLRDLGRSSLPSAGSVIEAITAAIDTVKPQN